MLLAAIGWSGAWFWAARQGEQRLAAEAATLRQAGWDIAWSESQVSGWPFRFLVRVRDVRLIDPSGRGISTAALNAEAYAYAPRRWVAAAPSPVTLHRGEGASVVMRGRLVRLGLDGMGGALASATFEGNDLTFEPSAGQAAFPLTAAKRMVLSLRAGPDDQGAVLFSGQGLTTRGGGLIARLSGGQAADLDVEALFTERSALDGDDWLESLAAWRAADGRLQIRKARLAMGGFAVSASGGPLAADAAGRVQGGLTLDLSQAGSWAAMAQALGAGTLTFVDGKAKAGPATLGPAPRLY